VKPLGSAKSRLKITGLEAIANSTHITFSVEKPTNELMVGEEWRGLERRRVISRVDKGIITAKQIRTKETNLITSCFLRLNLPSSQTAMIFRNLLYKFSYSSYECIKNLVIHKSS